jgi:hypothetical protein
MQVLQLGPKIPIGKSKYGCKYCNEAPKFQLVKASMGVGITMKPQNSSW